MAGAIRHRGLGRQMEKSRSCCCIRYGRIPRGAIQRLTIRGRLDYERDQDDGKGL
jgi:hypothetical protein